MLRLRLAKLERRVYLGEKVVNEKEYLSAMITVYAARFPAVTSVMGKATGEYRKPSGVEKGGKLSCVVVARCLETSYETRQLWTRISCLDLKYKAQNMDTFDMLAASLSSV